MQTVTQPTDGASAQLREACLRDVRWSRGRAAARTPPPGRMQASTVPGVQSVRPEAVPVFDVGGSERGAPAGGAEGPLTGRWRRENDDDTAKPSPRNTL